MRRLGLFTILALGLAACGGVDKQSDVTAPTQTLVAGTYALSRYNDMSVPGVTEDVSGRIEITGGELILQSNGSYSATMTLKWTPVNGNVVINTERESGTFTVAGSNIAFYVTPSGPGSGVMVPWLGTIQGNLVTKIFDGTVIEYRK